jgi:hypothetical protein
MASRSWTGGRGVTVHELLSHAEVRGATENCRENGNDQLLGGAGTDARATPSTTQGCLCWGIPLRRGASPATNLALAVVVLRVSPVPPRLRVSGCCSSLSSGCRRALCRSSLRASEWNLFVVPNQQSQRPWRDPPSLQMQQRRDSGSRRAARRNRARDRCDQREDHSHGRDGARVAGSHLEQQAPYRSSQSD